MRLFVFFVLFVCGVLLAFGVDDIASVLAAGPATPASAAVEFDAATGAEHGPLHYAWISLAVWFAASFALGCAWALCALILGRDRRGGGVRIVRVPAGPRAILRSVPLPEART